jgi:hypothetical protein
MTSNFSNLSPRSPPPRRLDANDVFRPTMKNFGRKFPARILCLACLAGASASAVAGRAAEGKEASPTKEGIKEFIHDLLPTAWQKRPLQHFNVLTEVTPEGRKWRVPTPEQPMKYFSSPGKFVQTGWAVAAGEKPPPTADIEAAMRKALAANGYLPIENDRERPEILIVFTFGSSGTDPLLLAEGTEADQLPSAAEELVTFVLRDPNLLRDVVERARFVAGDRYALELKSALEGEISNRRFNQSAQRAPGVGRIGLPVNPEAGSPFQLLLNSGSGDTARRLAELAFHTCYIVVATAYDFRGVESRQKIPLWQTRMAVGTQGVAMDEVLKPLIANAGSYLGRETPEAVVITHRLNREGRVEIGTPTVVEEPKPAAAEKPRPP